MKILYAEDERQLSMAVCEILKMEGYDVVCAYDGQEAIDLLKAGYFDAAILDIMMPKVDGIEVLRQMRLSCDYTPVLMLTAKTTTDDRIDGLNCGADDYLGKPFVMKELLAHLSSMLRRNVQYKDKILTYSNITLDCETGELKSECGSLRLSHRETALLCLFLKHPLSKIPHEKVCSVLGCEKEDTGSVNLYITYLKNKLAQIHCVFDIVQEEDGYCIR